MIKVFSILLIIILPISLAIITDGFTEFRERKNYIRITFRQFYDVYKTTKHSKWTLKNDCVYYEKHTKDGYYSGSEIICFKTVFDKIQYKIFKKITDREEKKNERQKKQSLLSAKTVEIMQMWSEDIESYRLENIKNLQSMIDENNKKIDEYKKRVEELKNETKEL